MRTYAREQLLHNNSNVSARVVTLNSLIKFQRVDQNYGLRPFQDDVCEDLKISISYNKTWKAKEYALNLLKGTHEDSFAKLPSYVTCLRVIILRQSQMWLLIDYRFKIFFMAMDAGIRGFQYIRLVIVIDATHLKAKYLGLLFVAWKRADFPFSFYGW
ncbi:hypothetical protein Pint_20848 [Pistacia integerrima]|uniref:Uncharacterized protein n=1 Tax=Pistacia integerrima TaxID=434235 RepID=A0ACC0XDD0_9ROSI|nr:hypothetical protein Pint_20848 [Pistacia integerrima]